MERVLNDPQYKGKHFVLVAGKVFTARTGEGAAKILEEVDRDYPDEVPAITYIPDADTLIHPHFVSMMFGFPFERVES